MNPIAAFVKGCLIGIANIIPGVSGGTMALVLGIYERLIEALHNIGPQTVREVAPVITFRRAAIARALAELKRIDAWFLAILGAGAIAAIVATAKLMEYLLVHHHDPTYGFFSGLILVSIVVPVRMMKGRFTATCWIAGLVAAALAVSLALSMIGPQQAEKARRKAIVKGDLPVAEMTVDAAGEAAAPTSGVSASPGRLVWFFVCGAVAISAMILPGISGSFMLLVMGAYFDVLEAIETVRAFVFGLAGLDDSAPTFADARASILVLMAVMLGCGIGLVVFTRLLNHVLKHYHDPTMAFLTGLMVGSLYGLWPFREFEMVAEEKVYTSLALPQPSANLWLTVLAFVAGGAIVAAFLWYERRKPTT